MGGHPAGAGAASHVNPLAATHQQTGANDSASATRTTTSTATTSTSDIFNPALPPRPFFKWIFEEKIAFVMISALIMFFITRTATELQRIVVNPLIVRSFSVVSNHHPRFERICNRTKRKIVSHHAPVPGDLDGDGEVDGPAEVAIVIVELALGLLGVYIFYRLLMRAHRRASHKAQQTGGVHSVHHTHSSSTDSHAHVHAPHHDSTPEAQ